MCGPSSQMKALNNRVQNLAKTMESEASSIWGTANSVVNTITNSIKGIIAGGASQMGYSAAELSAYRAQNLEASAAMTRNLKGAAMSQAAAIGGGNVVMPSGAITTAGIQAEIAGQEAQAQGEANILEKGYEVGRENYFKSLGIEAAMPGILEGATGATKDAMSADLQAQKSQQEMDTQSNWWKTGLMKLGTAAVGMIPGVGPELSAGMNAFFGSNVSPMSIPKSGGSSSPTPSPASPTSQTGFDNSGYGF